MGKKDRKLKGERKAKRVATVGSEDEAALVAGTSGEDTGVRVAPAPVDATHVATRLNSASIGLLRRLNGADASLGVSSTRLSALSVLVLGGPRTLGHLADVEGVTPPSMTRLVTAMEADGLVERSRSDEDGRLVIVAATERGGQLLKWGGDARVAVLSGMVRTLTEDQQRTLSDAAGILDEMLRTSRRP